MIDQNKKVFPIDVDEIKNFVESPVGHRLTIQHSDICLDLIRYDENNELIRGVENSVSAINFLLKSTAPVALIIVVLFLGMWGIGFFPFDIVCFLSFWLMLLYAGIFIIQMLLPRKVDEKTEELERLQRTKDIYWQKLQLFLEERDFIKEAATHLDESLRNMSVEELKNRLEEAVRDMATQLVRMQYEFAKLNRTDALVVSMRAKSVIKTTNDLSRLIAIINKYKFADDEVKYGEVMRSVHHGHDTN